MYARGMTVREIQGFLADQYDVDVSPEFISSVTDAVMAEVMILGMGMRGREKSASMLRGQVTRARRNRP